MVEQKRLEGANLVTNAYLEMKHAIITKQWLVGSKIPGEVQLAKEMGVSRNTIRGALQRLNSIGMIETRHGSGSYVIRTIESGSLTVPEVLTPINKDEIIKLLEFRKGIEAEGAYLAAQKRREKDLLEIKLAVTDMMSRTNDSKEYSEADVRFHLAISSATQNELFYSSMLNLRSALETHFSEMNSTIGTQFSANDHWNIYMAIERKEAELAKVLMYCTIDRSIKVLREEKATEERMAEERAAEKREAEERAAASEMQQQ